MGWRRHYYVLASVAFVAMGVIILVRSVVGRVLPVGMLGLVFIALGLVRLREFWQAKG